ncbi:MAG: hypothetical protein DHS20C13_26110 [Thermodesulfobacteriota bacterium]|nr:MAG: hypothetical protein DHS20C13_26110 [Thermodesulfobacteriota bacterium]
MVFVRTIPLLTVNGKNSMLMEISAQSAMLTTKLFPIVLIKRMLVAKKTNSPFTIMTILSLVRTSTK